MAVVQVLALFYIFYAPPLAKEDSHLLHILSSCSWLEKDFLVCTQTESKLQLIIHPL